VTDIVETLPRRNASVPAPLLVLDRVRQFLDANGLGAGDLQAHRIGEGGGSNFTFLVERDEGRYVLRRPPRPPLPPSAHDMVREARLQLALAPLGIRVPRILAVCEDESVLGVPFYVMDYIDGEVVSTTLPAELERSSDARRRLGEDLVDTLAEIHAADVQSPALAAFVRPGSYLERQVRRFSQLWLVNATRELPSVEQVGRELERRIPEPLPDTVVHGDYRLGNMIVHRDNPSSIAAVLDWEMGAIGDPRADVGYLAATYSEPGGEANPLGTSPVTATPGFPSREELVERYARASGRDVEPLAWFEALALWKAAVFCEAIYGRYVRGELTADDARAERFADGVPLLAELAAAALAR
jgi:aminoglycoside phosphotransferase (APT) family kinase protein